MKTITYDELAICIPKVELSSLVLIQTLIVTWISSRLTKEYLNMKEYPCLDYSQSYEQSEYVR